MSDNEKENNKLKVEDRRRFDSLGNERTEGQPTEQKSPIVEVKPQAMANKQPSAPKTDRPRRSDEITFTSFLMSLATQVLMQLGEMKPPPGVDIEKDLVGAKHTIDLLSLLQEKTVGNLDESETKLLEEMLHNLRMSFVRVSQGQA